jgi:hypothetical protein
MMCLIAIWSNMMLPYQASIQKTLPLVENQTDRFLDISNRVESTPLIYGCSKPMRKTLLKEKVNKTVYLADPDTEKQALLF